MEPPDAEIPGECPHPPTTAADPGRRMTRRVVLLSAMPPVEKPTLGGNHRYLLDLAAWLAGRAESVTVVCDGDDAYAHLCRELESRGASLVRAPLCTDAAAGAEAVDRAVRETRADVVHVNGHHTWLAPVWAACTAARSVDATVYTMHLPFHSVAHFGAQRPGWIQRLPGRWAGRVEREDRRFLAGFQLVLSVARVYGDALAARTDLFAGRTVVVPNAVDVADEAPRARGAREGPVVIGGAGFLSDQKRFDVALRACGALPDALDWRFRIAGEGEHLAKLQALATELGIAKRVEFCGYVTDMPPFYESLDVFVMSSDDEAAPLSQLEAMAHGLPSVVTDVGDLGSFVRDREDGFVVPRRDPAAMAKRLSRLVGDDELRARAGRSSWQRIRETFSRDAWSRRMENAYFR